MLDHPRALGLEQLLLLINLVEETQEGIVHVKSVVNVFLMPVLLGTSCRSRHGRPPYLNLLEASSTGLEALRAVPKHISPSLDISEV